MTSQGSVPHFKVADAPLVAFDLGDGISGQHAILYQSEDGRRLAGSFKESGVIKEVLPFDEFLYVVQGSTRITVAGEEPIELATGHCCYLRRGLDVTFEHSEDFQDVVVLVSDDPIDI